jgi:hypothetical protein
MHIHNKQSLTIAEEVFKRISDRFPSLRIKRDEDAPVEIFLSYPRQPGLTHETVLMLQNGDELHLSVGNFHLEWAPCTDASIVEAYIDAAVGFLSGKYRILKTYRGNEFFKGELQAPAADGQWETIGVSGKLGLGFPGKVHYENIQNNSD